MAIPLILIGKSSENKTHITGPNEMANEATNPKIPNSIRVEFIFIDAVINSDSYFFSIVAPNATATAFLKSVSLSKVFPCRGARFSIPISVGNLEIEVLVKV